MIFTGIKKIGLKFSVFFFYYFNQFFFHTPWIDVSTYNGIVLVGICKGHEYEPCNLT